MVNTSFKIKIEVEEKEKEIEIVLQEISPFTISDMTSDCLNSKGNNILPGQYLRLAIENGLIVSPKKLIEQIEECDNPIKAIGDVFQQVNEFCSSPRKYKLRQVQKESKEQPKSVESSNS